MVLAYPTQKTKKQQKKNLSDFPVKVFEEFFFSFQSFDGYDNQIK